MGNRDKPTVHHLACVVVCDFDVLGRGSLDWVLRHSYAPAAVAEEGKGELGLELRNMRRQLGEHVDLVPCFLGCFGGGAVLCMVRRRGDVRMQAGMPAHGAVLEEVDVGER